MRIVVQPISIGQPADDGGRWWCGHGGPSSGRQTALSLASINGGEPHEERRRRRPDPAGVSKSERWLNRLKHDHELDPDLAFTPDMKRLVFRSNRHGPIHVFAVEIVKGAERR
jgi:hypothetical protein